MLVKSKMIGFGCALPKNKIDNEYYAKYLDTNDEWIQTRTGIKHRYIATTETLNELATNALQEALLSAKKTASEIDVLIVATTTPDNVFPSCSTTVHGNLNMKQSAQCFDIAAACNGFIYALKLAKLYLKNDECNTVAIIGADMMSHVVDKNDRTTAILFGDGASAIILEKTTEDKGFLADNFNTNGALSHLLYVESGPNNSKHTGSIKMNGSEVFKHAVTCMSESVMCAIEKANLTLQDIDLLIPHQANIRIIESIIKRLQLPNEKVVQTVDMHANTSAASIPLATYQAYKTGLLKDNQTIAFCGFGAGLSWGSIIFRT